jgi:hypothetical protein
MRQNDAMTYQFVIKAHRSTETGAILAARHGLLKAAELSSSRCQKL